MLALWNKGHFKRWIINVCWCCLVWEDKVGQFTFKSDFSPETITNKLPESLDVSKLNMESMWLILLWKKCARTFVKPPTLSVAPWWIEPRWWKTKWCLCIICQCQEEMLWVCLCITLDIYINPEHKALALFGIVK